MYFAVSCILAVLQQAYGKQITNLCHIKSISFIACLCRVEVMLWYAVCQQWYAVVSLCNGHMQKCTYMAQCLLEQGLMHALDVHGQI